MTTIKTCPICHGEPSTPAKHNGRIAVCHKCELSCPVNIWNQLPRAVDNANDLLVELFNQTKARLAGDFRGGLENATSAVYAAMVVKP